ncbi:transcriptional repressor [Candidatus Curtissbacteria bacterium]|nr:transcriptional repressor [Candidatus Curtissbacteria bacterium]
MSVNHDCRNELKEASLKATPARLAILKLLESTEKPVDVKAVRSFIRKNNSKTDPATIFRILNSFTKRGLARQIYLNESKARYERANKIEHHHLICQSCGQVQDILDCTIFDLEKDILKKKGFLVKTHSMEFFGLCLRCQH